MTIEPSVARDKQQLTPDTRAGIQRRVVQVIVLVLFQAAVLFLSSGQLDWLWAFVYLGTYLVAILVNAVLMLRANPETIAERGRGWEEMKDWDKVVGGLFGVFYFVLILLVSGLDVRFGWTGEVPLAIHVAGFVAFVIGFALFSWSMVSNAYFSTVVRIQEDRGQTVCDTGPYRFVRHPGYVGAILQSLSVPLLLGSVWALIPAGIAVLLLVIRTALEDRTLHEELAGYGEYAARVRYRLLPTIW